MFSIVTANWNGEKVLNIFLESLTKQLYKNFKLYLVDNGSSDNSINIANSYKDKIDIKIIELGFNYGFAKANNIGISEAMNDENKYIITLNNDIELEDKCLLELMKCINACNDEYDVFQILLLNYYDREVIDASGIEFDKYYLAKQIGYKKKYNLLEKFNPNIDGVCAGAAVYSKRCLNAVKFNNEYFDSNFFAYYEDVDLALRLKKAGFKSLLISEALAFHIHSATSGKYSYFKLYYLTRNLFYYLEKNLDGDTFCKNKSIYLRKLMITIIKLIARGKFKAVSGTIRGYLDYKNILSKCI